MVLNENTLLHKVGSVSHQKHRGWRSVKNADFWATVDRILMASQTLPPPGVHIRNSPLQLSVKRKLQKTMGWSLL